MSINRAALSLMIAALDSDFRYVNPNAKPRPEIPQEAKKTAHDMERIRLAEEKRQRKKQKRLTNRVKSNGREFKN